MDSGDLFEATEKVGHYAMNVDNYENLPSFNWADIFAMALAGSTSSDRDEMLNRLIMATGSDGGEDPTPLIPS